MDDFTNHFCRNSLAVKTPDLNKEHLYPAYQRSEPEPVPASTIERTRSA